MEDIYVCECGETLTGSVPARTALQECREKNLLPKENHCARSDEEGSCGPHRSDGEPVIFWYNSDTRCKCPTYGLYVCKNCSSLFFRGT